MGELVATLLKRLAEDLAALLVKTSVKLAGLLPKIWVKLLALFAAIDYKHVENVATKLATRLALQFVSKNPQIQEATVEMANSLGTALRTDYFAVEAALVCCIMLFIAFIISPLTYKALSKPRLRIFISFNRSTREDISEQLEKYFENEGVRVVRIPYQEGASHQSIVIQTTEGIKRCDSFVCLPGYTQSYVEHEVSAATISEMPIVFVISENSGTLPNTADKRYPMFRLEPTIRQRFKPLINFMSYVGADLKSTWKLCQRALRHPFMHVSRNVASGLVSICILILWAYCFFRATAIGHNLTKEVPAFTPAEGAVVLAHAAVLIVAVSIAFICFSYVSLFLVNLVRQFQARRRARLKTVAAQFNRDDWIGVIPDLSPGGNMYECLFETVPSAHHEIGSIAHSPGSRLIRRKPRKTP